MTSFEVHMGNSAILAKMYVKSANKGISPVILSQDYGMRDAPIWIVILGDHGAMLDDPMLLREILLCK